MSDTPLCNGKNTVSVDGAQIWSFASGSGIPVLFFNGGPGCDDYLGPVAELIEDRCRVIRFEPRGCGRSTWDKRYDLQTLLNDADAVRQAYDYEQVVLLGHSYGPNAALAYTLTFPQHVLGIIGIAGGKVVDDRSWSATYHEKKESDDNGGQVFTSDVDVNAQGNQTWRAYCRRPELFGDLARLQTKTVFINAENDIGPNWPTQQLAHLLPSAKYIEIEGAGHTIWLTHAPQLKEELQNALCFILETP